MFKVGDKVKDKECGIILTIEDRENENGCCYLCSLPSGAMGYRYEHQLEIPSNNELEEEQFKNTIHYKLIL